MTHGLCPPGHWKATPFVAGPTPRDAVMAPGPLTVPSMVIASAFIQTMAGPYALSQGYHRYRQPRHSQGHRRVR